MHMLLCSHFTDGEGLAQDAHMVEGLEKEHKPNLRRCLPTRPPCPPGAQPCCPPDHGATVGLGGGPGGDSGGPGGHGTPPRSTSDKSTTDPFCAASGWALLSAATG